ncbi:HNH endonuclease signature motif containing protein, partial [Arthrobacter sp. AL12]|uniref:HNH endonuclease signature motif containing protein n=1 Tax=Arthrobacter sp. AL12 TaxID=3042241 RepID=UPI00249B7D97
EAGSDPWADPLRDRADSCLDGLAVAAREEARFAALKVRLTADYAEATRALASPTASLHDRAVQEMAMVAELACVLTVSEHAAGTLLAQSQALTTALPLTLEALQDGTISWDHARIMVDETADLGPAGAAALEEHFLDPGAPNPARGCPAGELVPGRFRAKSRTWRERHHPDSIEKRHTRSATDRRVEFAPDRDGMAWFSAYLPAVTAAGIWDRMTAAARALQGPDETRTLTQLRADVAATLLLGPGNGTGTGAEGNAGSGDVPVPRAQVLITVPVLSLLGATEEPAMLDGYGPIPPSVARALIADGAESFHRVLTDPRDGAPLEIGRANYRPTKAMRQWLRLRDGRCPFPGCNNPSLDNEADHLLAWADGGTTGITNLGQPCPKHHRLKHSSGWTPSGATKNQPPGWTSPSGRYYPSEQQDWEPPDWPPHLP